MGLPIFFPSFSLKTELTFCRRIVSGKKHRKYSMDFSKLTCFTSMPFISHCDQEWAKCCFYNLALQIIWHEHTITSLKKEHQLACSESPHWQHLAIAKLCHSLAVTDCQLKASHFIQQSILSQGKPRKTIWGHTRSTEREQHSRSPALSLQLPPAQNLFFITVYSGLQRG